MSGLNCILSFDGLLVLMEVPGSESPEVALEILLVNVIVELLNADLAVGLGLFDIGINFLANGQVDFLKHKDDHKMRMNFLLPSIKSSNNESFSEKS